MSSVVTPKSFCIDGIATLTMLTSSTDMNMPVTRTSRETIHGVDEARDRIGDDGGSDGSGAGVGGAGARVVVDPSGCSGSSSAVLLSAVTGAVSHFTAVETRADHDRETGYAGTEWTFRHTHCAAVICVG